MRELSAIRGFGPARLKQLEEKGIRTSLDLLDNLPVAYRDTTRPVSPGQAKPDPGLCIEGFVTGKPALNRTHGRQWVSAVVADECGRVRCMWFNQPWVREKLQQDSLVVLYGNCVQKKNGLFLINPVIVQKGVIEPVYRAIPGVGQKVLRDAVKLLLEEYDEPDVLSARLREAHGLMDRREALFQAHFPSDETMLAAAKHRLAFEELILFQAALSGAAERDRHAEPICITDEEERRFLEALPYQPTNAQMRVFSEIRADMAKDRSMARLVQGDVGSGKTIIALYALYACARSGGQGALMVPTEVLAAQQWQSAMDLLGRKFGITCGLLTGNMTAQQRKIALESIRTGEWQVIIGTHALISEGVEYRSLRLVVTDEQHRFGVRQRTRLQLMGGEPHVLVMSATPIPRTLSLILYGDLDLSVVDELPPGRIPVRTRIIPEQKREAMYGFIRKEAEQGHQTYVVCPLVGDEEDAQGMMDVPSASAMQRELEEKLKPLSVGLIHGRMKKQQKEDTLTAFREGSIDVLVTTTVIEVGVNVPNATIMVIEGAERFGLAQLHQLRGRVGRGAAESWCFLMAEPNARLQAMMETSDGFEIARRDLEIRGAGEVFGTKQHGAPQMPALMLTTETKLLDEARRAYLEIAGSKALAEEYQRLRRAALAKHRQETQITGFN